jgi:hypothetical protein
MFAITAPFVALGKSLNPSQRADSTDCLKCVSDSQHCLLTICLKRKLIAERKVKTWLLKDTLKPVYFEQTAVLPLPKAGHAHQQRLSTFVCGICGEYRRKGQRQSGQIYRKPET